MTQVGRICVAHPSYNGGHPSSHKSFWVGVIGDNSKLKGKLTHICNGGSLLCCTFNHAWCYALNMQLHYQDGKNTFLNRYSISNNPNKEDGWPKVFWNLGWLDGSNGTSENAITHFAMLHDDIEADDGWLDVLLDDLIIHKADLISAISPIKDMRGLTSTAIDNPIDLFNVERRLTVYELENLPDIFTSADCGYPDRYLLVNTGCWMCDFTKDWRLPPFHFNIQDTIALNESGIYSAGVASEDWNFSRWVNKHGGKVLASKKVKLNHWGSACYSNRRTDWGSWNYDKDGYGVFAKDPRGNRSIGR